MCTQIIHGYYGNTNEDEQERCADLEDSFGMQPHAFHEFLTSKKVSGESVSIESHPTVEKNDHYSNSTRQSSTLSEFRVDVVNCIPVKNRIRMLARDVPA